MLCQTPGCSNTFKRFLANPKKIYCNTCIVDRRECRTIRLARFKKKYKALGEPELKTIKYMMVKMDMKHPTDNQIKDLSNYFRADWKKVKDNLEISELASNSKYFSFNI